MKTKEFILSESDLLRKPKLDFKLINRLTKSNIEKQDQENNYCF